MGCGPSSEPAAKGSTYHPPVIGCKRELETKEEEGRIAVVQQYWAGLSDIHPLSTAKVADHKTVDSLWVIIRGKVYDCTRWQYDHPGGSSTILRQAGKDCTEFFERMHKVSTKNALFAGLPSAASSLTCLGTVFSASPLGIHHVGALFSTCFPPSDTAAVASFTPESASVHTAAVSSMILQCTVRETRFISANTRRITLTLPDSQLVLPIKPGGHMLIRATADVTRPYSPVEVVPGAVTIVTKAYANGIGSGFLHRLNVGDSVVMEGLFTPNFELDNFAARRSSMAQVPPLLVLIGAGTGAAPMLSIARAAAALPAIWGRWRCVVAVLCFRDRADAVLVSEFRNAADECPDRLRVRIVFSQEKCADDDTEFVGARLSTELLHTALAHELRSGIDMAVTCGPPTFDFSTRAFLTQLGLAAGDIISM
jgi:NAD(P)H-flavin reductase